MKALSALTLILVVLVSGCTPSAPTLPAQTPTSAATATAAVELSSIQYPESDPTIRLSYKQELSGPVEAGIVEAVANSPDQPYFQVHPAFVQLRFPEIAKDRTYQLPFPIDGPQMMVYRTEDFGEYAFEGNQSYPQQLSRLKDLIEKGVDPDHCAYPFASDQQALPFLPLLNSAQVFCAKAQPLAFEGGKGIRYVTYYAQGIGPAVDTAAFYTFQGLSDDGQYYLSAILPIQTNVLPDEDPGLGSEPDLEALGNLLKEQVIQINAQADEQFTPALSALDELIGGVSIPGE